MRALLLAQEEPSGLPWYAVLFWLWLLTSLGVYLYRLYRRFARGPQPKDDDLPPVRPPTSPAGTTSPASTSSPSRQRPDSRPEATLPADGPTARLFRDQAGAGRGHAHGADDRSPVDGLAIGRAQRAVSPTPSTDSNPDPSAGRQPVAKLLQGISMPCDLGPITGGPPANPMKVAFFTTRFGGAEVGASVGDELERLGFSLRSVSDNQVSATSEAGSLLVTIVTAPADLTREGRPTYPTVPATAVVVEFESTAS